MTAIENCFNEFLRGRISVFVGPRLGAPKMATMEDEIPRSRIGQLSVREIAETVGISKDRVVHILHDILGMKKLSARLLTPDNNRETTSKQCLTLFKRNPKEFLRRFVTVDETWPHLAKKKVLFHRGNAPVHHLRRRHGQIARRIAAPYPPYSPDLAPRD